MQSIPWDQLRVLLYGSAGSPGPIKFHLEDGSWFAEIPDFPGVWANAKTVEACRRELWTVLEERLILKLRDRESIPKIAGVTLRNQESYGCLNRPAQFRAGAKICGKSPDPNI